MSATFPCPHCGATYPVKPVLVGRAVRCTTCKNPFRLRPDGIADKVVDEAPPAPAAPPQPAPAAPPARTPTPAPSDTASAPASAAKPPPSIGTARSTRAASSAAGAEQREAQRKALAANLASAATAALAAESVKEETQSKTERKTKSGRVAKKNTSGGVGDIGPAVLTGHGDREHRNNLMWLLGVVGFVAAVTAIFFLFALKSPQRRALERFTDVVEGERSRYGERILAIQERAWLTGAAPITDLGSLRLGSIKALPTAPLRPLLTETLKDLVFIPPYKLWGEAGKSGEIEKLWNTKRDDAFNVERLTSAKVRVVEHKVVLDQLQSAGWSADDAELFLALVTGHTNRAGDNWIAKKWFAGELPDRLEVCSFTGTNGNLLIDLGRSYKPRTVDYQGVLLRFVGEGWSDEWKVLLLKTTSRE